MKRQTDNQAATRAVLDAYAITVAALEARLRMARWDRDRVLRELVELRELLTAGGGRRNGCA